MKKTFIAAVLTLFSIAIQAESPHRLWYDRPAQTWTQALPIGNGVMGGMVFGRPAIERIQLNEETIWAGGPTTFATPRQRNTYRRCDNSSSTANTVRLRCWPTRR